MNKYQTELQSFRPDDEIQEPEYYDSDKGYCYLPTASHGYLVVPKEDKNANIALKLCHYGYVGAYAIYLEQDKEANDFLKLI